LASARPKPKPLPPGRTASSADGLESMGDNVPADRILRPDETPIFWRLNEQEQKALIRLAEHITKTIRVHGVEIGLAPIEHREQQTTFKTDSLICGTALITEFLRRFINLGGNNESRAISESEH